MSSPRPTSSHDGRVVISPLHAHLSSLHTSNSHSEESSPNPSRLYLRLAWGKLTTAEVACDKQTSPNDGRGVHDVDLTFEHEVLSAAACVRICAVPSAAAFLSPPRDTTAAPTAVACRAREAACVRWSF